MGGGMSIEMWLAEDDDVAARSELQRSVFDEFTWEPTLDAADINVMVADHVVTLSGAVKSYPQKLAAERAAERVRGVQAVQNELAVVAPASDRRSDTEIARAAAAVLESDVLVPRARVWATVADGRVRLEGSVRRDAERREAEEAVQRLVGVKGVTNVMTVEPTAPPEDLKRHVEEALAHSTGLQRDHIKVEARDGGVVLHGRVRCLAERHEAERAAWGVPGVTDVRDELQVER
jgi:osmotically-inducible protein OsmY